MKLWATERIEKSNYWEMDKYIVGYGHFMGFANNRKNGEQQAMPFSVHSSQFMGLF